MGDPPLARMEMRLVALRCLTSRPTNPSPTPTQTSYKLTKSLEEEFPGVATCAQHLRDETTEFRKNLPVHYSYLASYLILYSPYIAPI